MNKLYSLRITKIATISEWIAIALLLWMLSMVGWSVQLAKWGDLPNIVPTIILAATTAFIASRFNISIFIKLAVFFIVGTAVVLWQGSIPADGANVIEKIMDAWNRFGLWIDIAINGGVSGDSVPFAIIFMTVSWIVSYSVTALTLKTHSPWVPALLLGLALLTNLSHRQGLHEQTFYLFMIGAIAQFAHLTAVKRIDRWNKAGLKSPREAMWGAARDGIMLSAVVMLFAALIPLWEPRSITLRDGWNAVFLDPLERFRSTAERLLAGIPGSDRGFLNAPNSVLPFQGGIELTEEPIMWIRSRYAKLHPGRVYQQYTSSGWVSAPSVLIQADNNTRLTETPQELGLENRDLVQITVQPLKKTDLVIPAAATHNVDYNTNVEILEPNAWDVPLIGNPEQIENMPEDLRELSFNIRLNLLNIAQRQSPDETIPMSKQPALDADTVEQVIEDLRFAPESDTPSNDETITFYYLLQNDIDFLRGNDGEPINFFYIIDGDINILNENDDVMVVTMPLDAGDNLILTLPQESDIPTISAHELGAFLSRKDLPENEGITMLEIETTLAELAEARGDAVAVQRQDIAEILADMELTVRRGTASSGKNLDWNSFNYNIFTEPNSSEATSIRIVRKSPPEQNSVTFDRTLEENTQYQVNTFVSTAEQAQLADSTDEYPLWITDRYLQLPQSLPQRVRTLAQNIVTDANAETPWKKIQAIKRFLQNQVYSLEIVGPGPFEDGIDYFLFQTPNEGCPQDFPECDATKIKGYSQYYGSAGTVLLRSIGIPARMIAGWSTGEYVPEEGQFMIRDRHRHGWTQAYIPPYGWIDIEVTPGRSAVPRNIRVPTVPFDQTTPGVVGSAEFDPDFLEDLAYLDTLALEARAFLARGDIATPQQQNSTIIPAIPWIAVSSVAAVAATLAIAVLMAWRWNLRGQPPAVKAYTQFTRIATILGYRRPQHHSAREYTNRLAIISLDFSRAAETLVTSYEKSIYGKPTSAPAVAETDNNTDQRLPQSEQKQLGKAWRAMCRSLLTHRIKRTLGITPQIPAL